MKRADNFLQLLLADEMVPIDQQQRLLWGSEQQISVISYQSCSVQIATLSVVCQQKSHWPTNAAAASCRMIAYDSNFSPSCPSMYQCIVDRSTWVIYIVWWPRKRYVQWNSNDFQFWQIKYPPLFGGDWQAQWSSLANWLCQLGKWNIWTIHCSLVHSASWRDKNLNTN